MISNISDSIIQSKHLSVQKVLEVAEEIVNENKVLNIEIIYSRSKRQLQIPRKGLLEIIQLLFSKKILIDGSKHTKKTVLFNQYRRKMYDLIYLNNGATFSLLREKVFNLQSGSTGQFLWHLKLLMKFDLIKKIKIGKYSVFLPITMDDDLGKLHYFLKKKKYQKILDLILSTEDIKMADVHKNVDIAREKVYSILKIMLEQNILKYVDSENNTLCISPKIKNLLQNNKLITLKNK